MKKKSYKYEKDIIEIEGHFVPKKVFDKAVSLSLDGRSVGIWEAESPYRGLFGFIVSPIDEIGSNKDRFLIKGYSSSEKGKEEIPEPFYTHSSRIIEKGGFSPSDREESRFEPASVRRIEPASWDVKISSHNKLFIKKSEWIQIGVESGWLKNAEIEKNKKETSENIKEAFWAQALNIAAIAVPVVMQMFGGNKEEAAQQVSQLQQNPGQLQQMQSQVSQASQKLDALIANLRAHAQKVGLSCAQMQPPSKCPGSSVTTLKSFQESYNKIESRYNGMSKGQSSENPCNLLKDALNLSSCAKSLFAALSEIGDIRPQDFMQSDMEINLA